MGESKTPQPRHQASQVRGRQAGRPPGNQPGRQAARQAGKQARRQADAIQGDLGQF